MKSRDLMYSPSNYSDKSMHQAESFHGRKSWIPRKADFMPICCRSQFCSFPCRVCNLPSTPHVRRNHIQASLLHFSRALRSHSDPQNMGWLVAFCSLPPAQCSPASRVRGRVDGGNCAGAVCNFTSRFLASLTLPSSLANLTFTD